MNEENLKFDLYSMPWPTKPYRVLHASKIKQVSSDIENLIPEETKISDNLKNVIWKMVQTCVIEGGIGLSAPQIGIFKNLFIIEQNRKEIQAPDDREFQVFLNPKFIIQQNIGSNTQIEGCLSVPGHRILIERKNEIKARWLGINPEGVIAEFEKILTGMDARVFLHEFDHLNGISILGRGKKVK